MVGKLKPCPCCGDPLPGMVRDRHSAYVACSTFGCWLSGPVAETEEGAARKWNALAGAAEEVERLRKEVDWLKLEAQNLDKILLSLVPILLVLTLLVTSITSQITKRKPQ